MQTGQFLGSPKRQDKIGIVVATIIVVVVMVVAVLLPSQESLERTRVENIRNALAQCATKRDTCIGGFVVYRFSDRIDRIGSCGNSCRKFEADVVEDLKIVGLELNEIHSIVLPDDPEWSKAAVAYARQFVVNKQQRP